MLPAPAQVIPCTKRFVHDWTICPFAHAGEKAVRRDPRLHNYTGIACPDMKKVGQAGMRQAEAAHQLAADKVCDLPGHLHQSMCKTGRGVSNRQQQSSGRQRFVGPIVLRGRRRTGACK
jgi:hypothetical protein